MNYKYIDGQKAVTLTGDEGWNFISQYPQTTAEEQYAKVSAVYRCYNLIANTGANMPFIIYKGKEEFDGSATWENKVKFMPNPSELLRLNILSLIATNTAYMLRTYDAFGYKQKGLYPAVSYGFYPWTNPVTAQLDYIERRIGSQIERYTPDDPRLVRLWRLDHTTEVLPSRNTEAQAIMSAAGQVYYADLWIQHFYQSGGVAPTLIAMKGLVDQTSKEDKEKSWSEWLLGIGRSFMRRARIYNAETMDVKQLGSSVTDLKNNDVYIQSLKNIAIGTGIPVSRLLSSEANYATAGVADEQWYRDDIIPRCNWIAYEWNRQIWNPLGLRMEFKPELLEPEEGDINQMSTFIDFLEKCPNFETFVGACETFNKEISDKMLVAAQAYYADKAAKANEPAPVVVQPVTPEPVPAKWIPTIEQIKEAGLWQTFAIRKLKKGLSLEFPFDVKTLPETFAESVRLALPQATTEDEIKAVFAMDNVELEMSATSDIKELAQAINRLAEKATA